MPTQSTQKVSMTLNSDGSFTAVVETDSTETVQIAAADLVAFIKSKDTTAP